MKVCVTGGRSGTLMGRIVRDIRSRMDGNGQYRGRGVLFVPEQYTLRGERELIAGLGTRGLLELDVMSPTKLKSLIRDRAGCTGKAPLGDAGRGLAVHKAMRDAAKDLEYYVNQAGLDGSVAGMERTLAEMKESGLSPEELRAEAAENAAEGYRAKYSDLARIWEEYDRLTDDRFEDGADAWNDACLRLAESGVLDGADLWVYGFDIIRPDLRELIFYAAGVCASVTVWMTMAPETAPDGRIFRPQRESAERLAERLAARGVGCRIEYPEEGRKDLPEALDFLERNLYADKPAVFPKDSPGPVSLFTASHPMAEAARVASELWEWHEKGVPWNRMALALPTSSMVEGALEAALTVNEIPFFTNRKYPLTRHGVCRFFKGALECLRKGYRTEFVVLMAESGYGPLNREEGAELDEYAAANGIEYGKWAQPFSRGQQAERAEGLRLRLTTPLERLRNRLAGAETVGGSVRAMVMFLEECGVWEQLRERQEMLIDGGFSSEAVIGRQIWTTLMEILDRLYVVLGDKKCDMAEVTGYVTGAMERSVLSSLPEEGEGVTIGEIGHILPGQTDVLILCGATAGAMDPGNGDLLLETERAALDRRIRELAEKSGTVPVPLGTDPATRVMLRRFDYYRTMTLPTKYLMVTWSLKTEEGTANQPGEPVLKLKKLFGKQTEEGGIFAEGLPSRPWTPAMALEGLCYLIREMTEAGATDLPPDWKKAFAQLYRSAVYGETIAEMAGNGTGQPSLKRLAAAVARRLYDRDAVSITRLETFAGCPYRHFIQYGLRPVNREEWDFTAAQAGEFFHGAMERYIREARRHRDWPGLDEKQVRDIMEPILSDLTREWAEGPLGDNETGVWRGEAYLRRVNRSALVLTRFAANSDFGVVGTEMAFGMGEGSLPPLRLESGDGTEIRLQGKIDRLDEYRGAEGRYLRVTDLKSSGRTLSAAKWLRGESLQLPLYLKVAENSVPGAMGGAAVYFPMTDREVDAADPDEAEEKRIDDVRMKGIVLAREEVIRAIDRDKAPYSMPAVLKADGEVAKSVKWALDDDVMRGVTDASVKIAGKLCERILSGEIHPAPSVDGQYSACTYCGFYPVCGKRKKDERETGGKMTFAEALEEFRREEDKRKDENRT